MQLNETEKMANDFVDILDERIKDCVDCYTFDDISDDPNYRTFSINFFAYEYFYVSIYYERGSISCNIKEGEHYIHLKNSQEWYPDLDIDQFVKELRQELELRIPDKYLEAHGWK